MAASTRASSPIVQSEVEVKKDFALMQRFSEVPKDLDLNSVPSSCLRNETTFPNSTTRGNSAAGPSSVSLGASHLECVQKVDVISDSRNIKALLQLPYSKGQQVSMAVHRMGNTLLIDNFRADHVQVGMQGRKFKGLVDSGGLPQLQPESKQMSSTGAQEKDLYSALLYCGAQGVGESEEKDVRGPAQQKASAIPLPYERLPIRHSSDKPASAVASEVSANDEVGVSRMKDAEAQCEDDGDDSVAQQMASVQEKYSDTVEASFPNQINLPIHSSEAVIGTPSPLMPQTIVSTTQHFSQAQVQSADTHSSIVSEPIVEEGELFPNKPKVDGPNFLRNVVWKLEDISMLLGCDLPIFQKGGPHPAISLRLKDMDKPITVLTGLDCWLDNLMCNVPEVLMYYHINGVVQHVNVMRTEDIPNLQGSQFDPRMVYEYARNILNFLKNNCAKEGHTYWLFKDGSDDLVKLYDLTTLSYGSEEGSDGDSVDHNVFAQPVAALFYRVAHTLLDPSHGGACGGDDQAIACLLLKTCTTILKSSTQRRSLEMLASAYCLLAGIHLPQSLEPNPAEKTLQMPAVDSAEPDEATTEERQLVPVVVAKEDSFEGSTSVSLATLYQTQSVVQSWQSLAVPPLELGSHSQRCRSAIEFITESLLVLEASCLQELVVDKVAKLLIDASRAFFGLSSASLSLGLFGRALRYIGHSLTCLLAARPHCDNLCVEELLASAWKLCGNVHMLLAKVSGSLARHEEDFLAQHDKDTTVLSHASARLSSLNDADQRCLLFQSDIEQCLLCSVRCYENALARAQMSGLKVQKELGTCLGSVWNEMGLYYMQLSETFSIDTELKQAEKFWKSCHSSFTRALEHFTSADDQVHIAVVHCNLSRLFRLCATAYSSPSAAAGGRKPVSPPERQCYQQAVDHLLLGLSVLGRKGLNQELRTDIKFELSSVYFTMGKLMQDFAPSGSAGDKEVGQQVVGALQSALHYTDALLKALRSDSPKRAVLLTRGGEAHSRIAREHHRQPVGAASAKLASNHYHKALQYFMPEQHIGSILQVTVERADLMARQGKQPSLKVLTLSFQCLLEAVPALQCHMEWCSAEQAATSKDSLSCMHLSEDTWRMFTRKLQNVLKDLTAVSSRTKSAQLAHFKGLYLEAIRLSSALDHSSLSTLTTLSSSAAPLKHSTQ